MTWQRKHLDGKKKKGNMHAHTPGRKNNLGIVHSEGITLFSNFLKHIACLQSEGGVTDNHVVFSKPCWI